MTIRTRKNRRDIAQGCVYREDDAGEELEIEVDFDAQWDDGGVFLDNPRRTDNGTPIEVSAKEIERITLAVEKNRRDCDDDLRADAAESRAESLRDR